jgi:hypothetical protein
VLPRAQQPTPCPAAGAAYPEWLADSSPTWAFRQIEELLDEGLDDEQFRVAARDILT